MVIFIRKQRGSVWCFIGKVNMSLSPFRFQGSDQYLLVKVIDLFLRNIFGTDFETSDLSIVKSSSVLEDAEDEDFIANKQTNKRTLKRCLRNAQRDENALLK